MVCVIVVLSMVHARRADVAVAVSRALSGRTRTATCTVSDLGGSSTGGGWSAIGRGGGGGRMDAGMDAGVEKMKWGKVNGRMLQGINVEVFRIASMQNIDT